MITPAIDSVTLDLIDWLGERERTYQEVMFVSQTASPQFAIWREAIERGFVTTEMIDGRCVVKPTSLGLVEGELRRESRRAERDLPPTVTEWRVLGTREVDNRRIEDGYRCMSEGRIC